LLLARFARGHRSFCFLALVSRAPPAALSADNKSLWNLINPSFSGTPPGNSRLPEEVRRASIARRAYGSNPSSLVSLSLSSRASERASERGRDFIFPLSAPDRRAGQLGRDRCSMLRSITRRSFARPSFLSVAQVRGKDASTNRSSLANREFSKYERTDRVTCPRELAREKDTTRAKRISLRIVPRRGWKRSARERARVLALPGRVRVSGG